MVYLKKLGNKVFRFIDYHVVPFFGWVSNSKNKFVNVIYYHDIVPGIGDSYMQTNKGVFFQQMEWLSSNGFETLRFDDINEQTIRFKKKRILITFDDGWLSNYNEVFDFMQAHNLKYNIFLTIGEIGKNTNYLTWDMVREMHNSGLVGFGAHTFTHPSMADLIKVNVQLEVNNANTKFNNELGITPLDFCYPFGYYSEDSNLRLEKESPYKRIYTSCKMYSYKQNGKVIFGRNGISSDHPLHYFKKMVLGYTNWYQVYYKHVYRYMLNLYHIIRG